MVMDSETGAWYTTVGGVGTFSAPFDLADMTVLVPLMGCKSALRLRLLLDLVIGWVVAVVTAVAGVKLSYYLD